MLPLGLFGPLGFTELLIILAILVFIFGARKIPEMARGLGEGIRGFRSSLRGDENDVSESDNGEKVPVKKSTD